MSYLTGFTSGYTDAFGSVLTSGSYSHYNELEQQLAVATQAANYANNTLLPQSTERIASLDNTIQELQNQISGLNARFATSMNDMGMTKAEEQKLARQNLDVTTDLITKLNALQQSSAGFSSVEQGYQGQISALNSKIAALQNPSDEDLASYLKSHGLAGTVYEGLFGMGSTEATGNALGQIGQGAGKIVDTSADIATQVTKMLPLILVVVAISAIRK